MSVTQLHPPQHQAAANDQRAGNSTPPSGGEERGDAPAHLLSDDELLCHFGPVRRSREPMAFEPAWYREARRDAESLPPPMPACTGDACQQGHAPCTQPGSCHLPADDEGFGAVQSLVLLMPWILKAWAAIAVAALFFWWVVAP